MLTLMKMGFRNIRRRRRRSILTSLTIFVGTMLIVFTVGLQEGTYDEMTELATRSLPGHFQVQAERYHDKPSLFRTVSEPDEVLGQLLAQPGIAAVTGRVETAGLLSAANQTTSALLLGIDPESERTVSNLHRNLKEGCWLDEVEGGELPIVLGAGLARRLQIGPGDELSFLGQAADGSIAADLFTVCGLVESGASDFDSGLALIRLEDAQYMLALEGRVHCLAGVVDTPTRLDRTLAGFDPGAGNRLLPWPVLLEELARSIKSDRDSGRVFLLIIVVVVVLGVTNTMMMSVFERTREIGVMLALGTSPGRVVSMILCESFWLTLIGVTLGVLVGALLNTHLAVPMGAEPVEFGGVVIETMHGANHPIAILYFPLVVFTAGIIAGLPPALRAARLAPAQALRHN
ncbi:MAG: ABC transporter permease [bacterium]|nr:ABC transporter permease [bacterium]